MKILCIEDEKDFRDNIVEILKNEGFETKEASTATEALSIITNNEFVPDLIICDIDLPKMNGFEFVTKLYNNEKFSQIPVFFLTAYSDKKNIIQSKNILVDDYYIKPVDYDIFLANIKSKIIKQRNILSHQSTIPSAHFIQYIMDINSLAELIHSEAIGEITNKNYLNFAKEISKKTKEIEKYIAKNNKTNHKTEIVNKNVDLLQLVSKINNELTKIKVNFNFTITPTNSSVVFNEDTFSWALIIFLSNFTDANLKIVIEQDLVTFQITVKGNNNGFNQHHTLNLLEEVCALHQAKLEFPDKGKIIITMPKSKLTK